ncbi:polysaccharide deacetylase family protein [bacterium]|nr:polysaccharide deacetylase family protein [bacterium]
MFQFLTLIFISLSTFAKVDRPPQYVILAFDGSKNLDFWQESREFAKNAGVKFTYFMSGVYFIPNDDKNTYVEPKFGKGKSNIGFGGTRDVLPLRLEQVRLAAQEGHEMASHANAHFDGSSYTEKQWKSEFEQFNDIFTNCYANYDKIQNQPMWWEKYFTKPEPFTPEMPLVQKQEIIASHLVGFRAPLLGVGSGLWKTLQDYGYLYDTSRTDKMNYWPKKLENVWNFPLAGLQIYGTNKKTLSMDYNFYFSQSQGAPAPASKHKQFEDEMYNTYLAYFQYNYLGNRAPLHIGHHFSKWNGGAYWNAMQRFAEAVCAKPEVQCVTYKDLLNFVELNAEKIADYQDGNFDKMTEKEAGMRVLPLLRLRAWGELSDEDMQTLRATGGDHASAHDD